MVSLSLPDNRIGAPEEHSFPSRCSCCTNQKIDTEDLGNETNRFSLKREIAERGAIHWGPRVLMINQSQLQKGANDSFYSRENFSISASVRLTKNVSCGSHHVGCVYNLCDSRGKQIHSGRQLEGSKSVDAKYMFPDFADIDLPQQMSSKFLAVTFLHFPALSSHGEENIHQSCESGGDGRRAQNPLLIGRRLLADSKEQRGGGKLRGAQNVH